MSVIEWLTIREAADRFGLSASTVRWHCRMPQGLLYGRAKRTNAGAYTIRSTDARDLADRLNRRKALLERRNGGPR